MENGSTMMDPEKQMVGNLVVLNVNPYNTKFVKWTGPALCLKESTIILRDVWV